MDFVRSPTRDLFQLDRLAEELVVRESTHPTSDDDGHILDLPDLPIYVPLSHDNKHLTANDFNVEEFLLSRSYTSLPELRAELRDYLSDLKEELVRLINDDYEAFISLSTDLKDEGERLNRLKFPLGGVKSEVLKSKNELRAIQYDIQENLEKRATLREQKALLHLLLKISESVTRLESLLLITSPDQESATSPEINGLRMSGPTEDRSEDRSSGNKAKHLGRVAAEYTQLLYHVSKARAEKCLFVDEIQWQIDRIKSTISADLDQLFAKTLVALTDGKGESKGTEKEKTRLNADLTECLRTYDVLGLWRDAEDVIRREVVRRFVKKTIYPGALTASHSPIIPHTPLPALKTPTSMDTTSLPPRTPYTPFTAFPRHPTLQSNYSVGSNINQPYAHFFEDSDDPLVRLYGQILRFIERDLSRIMDIAEKVSVRSVSNSRSEKEITVSPPALHQLESNHEKGFEIMANVIWQEFGTSIMDDLGSIVFSVGRPSEFRKHHEITQAFIHSLEYLAPSVHSIEVMRAHHVYSAFERRWQLPVYFQMRWKEIVGNLEEALSVKRMAPRFNKDKNGFATDQAIAVWVAINACWSAEVFIPELCHRFWKLTLQILSRYKTWLNECFSNIEYTPKQMTEIPDKSFASSSLSRASTPIPPTEAVSAENTTAEDAALQQYAAAIIDVRAMQSNISSIWREEISMVLPEIPNTADYDRVTVEEALRGALSDLTSLIPFMSTEITTILTRRCCEALLPVRSIPSQFRAMSNKRPPSEPSYFVSSLLRPIKLFFAVGVSEGPGLLLRDDFLQSSTTEIFDSVSQRYAYYLTAMKKTEESLRRLKKGKKATFSLFGNTNQAKDDDGRDEERIRTQMIYDVEAFGKDAESLGVTLECSESYKALEDMVHASEALDMS